MDWSSLGASARRHRLGLSLAGIVVGCAVILPACNLSNSSGLTDTGDDDLRVTKVGVVSGQTVTYTVTIVNDNSTNMPGPIVLTDSLTSAPAGTTFASTTATTCTGIGGAGPLSCTWPGLAGSGIMTITIVATVPAGSGGTITNCAILSDDDDLTNNRSCTTNEIAGPATGSITIVKNADPDDPQDFAFSSSQASIAPFSLDDDADGTLPNQKSFATLPAGSYTFTETAVSGWSLTGIVCTPVSGTTTNTSAGSATIVLTAGANVTCVFTNTKVVPATGSITIVKDAQPDDAQDFAFSSNQASIAPFSLDDDTDPTLPNQKAFSGLPVASYTFTEAATAGWDLTGIVCTPAAAAVVNGSGATVTLTAGASVTCVFTNKKVVAPPPLTGTITIVKDASPNDPQDFAFTSNQASIPGFSLDDDSDGTLSNQKVLTFLTPGSYSFTETAVSGWNLTSVVCTPATGTSFNAASGALTINLTAGADVTCVFTNTKAAPTTGTITIVKDANPNDAQDFAFTSNQASIPGFSLDDDSEGTLSNQRVFANLPPGSYAFTETAVSGWNLTGVVCTPSTGTSFSAASGALTINLTGGADITCVFTNTKAAPTTGTVTIVKDANPNDAQDFAFTSNQAGIPGFSLDDDADATLSNQKVFANLAPGSYAFTETAVSGWNLTSVVCTPSTGTSFSAASGALTINLTAGANVSCVFTNTKAAPAGTGTITIVSDAQPDDPQDFHFVSVGAGMSDFDLDDDADATLPRTKTFTLAAGGTYKVTESAVSGWTVPSLQCLVAVPGATITFTDQLNRTFTISNLEAGAVVTCTFLNSR